MLIVKCEIMSQLDISFAKIIYIYYKNLENLKNYTQPFWCFEEAFSFFRCICVEMNRGKRTYGRRGGDGS